LLTGSYRSENVLELWDLRNMKKYRDVLWDGPKTKENFEKDIEEDKNDV
jgi:hypothetical protein